MSSTITPPPPIIAPDPYEVEGHDDHHGHDHHGHEHHPRHQHHFATMDQQFDAAKMGMWIFLVTEVLLFSGMFVAYTVYRIWYPEVFVSASELLDPYMGLLNTLVLLTSSLTIAMAVRCAQVGDQKALFRNLVATVALAGVFMVVKAFEYGSKFSHGIFPGENFAPHGEGYAHFAEIAYAPQFFSIYYVMTGIHGFHVVVGMILISVIAWKAKKGAYTPEWYTPVEMSALYWHIVDIVWIFVFPLLYLIH
ncbi:MAG: cytochrome c oxidase subunit 3 family protein [Bacteroidota bacterium]